MLDDSSQKVNPVVNPVKRIYYRVKNWIRPRENELLLVWTIVAVSLISFGLGRISVFREEKTPIIITPPSQSAEVFSSSISEKGEESKKILVGSKNGSVYHLASCPGAGLIKEENKIYFSSKEEAEKAGYRPAANCPNL